MGSKIPDEARGVIMMAYARDVVVGTIIQGGYRENLKDRWKIIAMAHGEQVQVNYTLWWKAQNLVDGKIVALKPRPLDAKVRMVVSEEEAERGRAVKPSTIIKPEDSEAIALLIEELGATAIATVNNKTGEVECPNFILFHQANPELSLREEMLIHLEIAHGMDISALEESPDPFIVDKTHDDAHDPRYDHGKGGFPHRHVPEDHTTMAFSHRKA